MVIGQSDLGNSSIEIPSFQVILDVSLLDSLTMTLNILIFYILGIFHEYQNILYL